MDIQVNAQPPKPDVEIPKRRNFLSLLVGGAGAAVGLGIIGWRVWPHGTNPARTIAAGLPPLPSRDSFAQQLQTNFTVTAQTPDGASPATKPIELKLVEVTESKSQLAGNRSYHSFSILFEGPRSAALSQQTCAFRHPQLGTFDLFLVQIGKPKGDVVRYQAVFSIYS